MDSSVKEFILAQLGRNEQLDAAIVDVGMTTRLADDDGQDSGWPVYRFPYPTDGDDDRVPYPTNYPDPRTPRSDHTLAILIPLIVVLSTLLFLILVLTLVLLRRRRGISLSDEGGPTNLEREEELVGSGEGGFDGVEARWMESVEEATRTGYQRAKDWQTQYPPNSQPTEITLSQFLSIQEKGVSAWSFEPDYESNPCLIVQSRTEITFLEDGFGMAPQEGGGCCVQSNLPLPKLNEVYYWECKMFEKPEATNVAIGLATKPYPSFRLPGWNRYSIGYHSADGFKSHSFPFTSTSYGPPLLEGDTLGVGYRPRSGTVFFTRNGKKLEDAFVGFNKYNLFPTVGADGACSIHVNLGQAGFVFIEANVKKWGLAPMMGTLAPPPAYGSERGSILLESAVVAGSSGSSTTLTGAPSNRLLPHDPNAPARSSPSSSSSSRRHLQHGGRTNLHRHRRTESAPSLPPTAAGAASALGSGASSSPSQPIRPSPLRHARHASSTFSTSSAVSNASDRPGTGGGGGGGRTSPGDATSAGDDRTVGEDDEDEDVHNPPTPGLLDISLHSIHRFPNRIDSDSEDESMEGTPRRRRRGAGDDEDEEEDDDESEGDEDARMLGVGSEEQTLEQRLLREVARERGETASTRSVSPPAYHPIDPHMYAPGVAETILEDALQTGPPPSSAHGHHGARSSSSRPSSSSTQVGAGVDPSRSLSILAQLGLAPRSSGASSPSSGTSTGRYEGRTGSAATGRGGLGNFAGSSWNAVMGGGSSPGPGSGSQPASSTGGQGPGRVLGQQPTSNSGGWWSWISGQDDRY